MHQTSTFGQASWPLRLLICLMALLHPVLLTLPLEFSHAYSQLIASVRVLPPWWATCRDVSRSQPQVCLQYLAPLPEENVTGTNESVSAHSQEAISEQRDVEPDWIVLIKVLMEEAFRVGLETAKQWLSALFQQDEDRTVQYDDNYASINGGAIVLRKSSQKIHNVQAILEDSSEKYLYSDAALPIEIVVALKEQVKIERISVRSNQVYSSIVREFVLEGALDLQQEGQSGVWFKLLSTFAKNSGAQQHFRVQNKVVRFLRLRILSKYGDWKYFTMTQLKVYGQGLFTEALIDYQTTHQISDPPRLGEVELATDLGVAYEQLMSFGGEKKPDENVLTFLLEKVSTLSKIHEFELFYMQNLSRRLENVTRIEREFHEHKNLYEARNAIFDKYSYYSRLEQKLKGLQIELKNKLSKQATLLEQLKFAELSTPEICPSKQEELKNLMIIYVATALIANIALTTLIAYCCLRYYRQKETQISKFSL